jgi:hypothetical protein
MTRQSVRIPNGVPVLKRGKHRWPRQGACFMEFASWLAGERFSDHPRCTHPMLGALARGVNDAVTDAGRRRIVHLVSRVVGLVGPDDLVAATVAVRAATTAMPVAAFEHQKALAVGLLRCEQQLSTMDERETAHLRAMTRDGLGHCPQATRWARKFVAKPWGRGQDFSRAATHVVQLGVLSISASSASDELLCDLLETTIGDCEKLRQATAPASATAPAPAPAPANYAKVHPVSGVST